MLQQSIKHHSLCLQSLPTIAPFLLSAQQAAGLFYLVRAQHEVGCWAYWLPAWCSLVPVNGCWHRLAFAVLQVVASCLKWVSHLLTQQLFWNSTEWWNQWECYKSTTSTVCFLELAQTPVCHVSYSPRVSTQTSWCLGSLCSTETVVHIGGDLTSMWELLLKNPLILRVQLPAARALRRDMI